MTTQRESKQRSAGDSPVPHSDSALPKLPTISDRTRTLRLVFGDQLDPDFTVFRQHFSKSRDVALMAEVVEESRHVASHKQRTVLLLSAMRHHAKLLRAKGVTVRYVTLDDAENTESLQLAGEARAGGR